jgi:hypothetical protein
VDVAWPLVGRRAELEALSAKRMWRPAIRHGRNRAAPPEAARRRPPGPSTARGMSRLTAEGASGKPEGHSGFATGRYPEPTVLS